MRENGVVVLVPRYGIEGIVYVCEAGAKNPFAFDQAEEILSSPSCSLRTFDKVLPPTLTLTLTPPPHPKPNPDPHPEPNPGPSPKPSPSPTFTLTPALDKVRVRISVDATKAHRPKLKLRITEPLLPTA